MTNLLRKPRRTSTALSSTMRMAKTIVIDGRELSTIDAPFEFWTMPGWGKPMLDVLGDDLAVVRSKGTPFATVQRIRAAADLVKAAGV